MLYVEKVDDYFVIVESQINDKSLYIFLKHWEYTTNTVSVIYKVKPWV